MNKIGIYINNTLSEEKFQEVLESVQKSDNHVIYSNYKSNKVRFFENEKEDLINLHKDCINEISGLHTEFYEKHKDSPLFNANFNFWPHLRFNSFLQMLLFYPINLWVKKLKNNENVNDFAFVNVDTKTKNLLKIYFPEANFLNTNNGTSQKVSKLQIVRKAISALFFGAIGSFSLFKKKKDTALLSIRGSVVPIPTENGLQTLDKFMYYVGAKIPDGNYETIMNSNLFSVFGLKLYVNDSIQKIYDIKGENIFFKSLFKIKFYKQFFKTRKYLKITLQKDKTLLGVMLQNNKGGVITELLTYWSYYYFLKKRKYKNIVLISEMSPATNSIVRVAKQFKINVIGIQHGLLNQNNFAYNYSNEELKVDNPFPNKLIVWGGEEADFLSKNKAILKDTVQSYGNVVLDGLKYLPKNDISDKFTILFATQPQPISSQRMKSIVDFVDAILQFNSHEIKVIIRLHPREIDDYELYKVQLNRLNKYDVELDKGKELFSQINKSDVLVTSYSTVSKDAMILRKPIVLQDYSESDITGLINEKVAINALNPKDLFTVLNKIKSKEFVINSEEYEKSLLEIYASFDFNVAEKIVNLLN